MDIFGIDMDFCGPYIQGWQKGLWINPCLVGLGKTSLQSCRDAIKSRQYFLQCTKGLMIYMLASEAIELPTAL